MPETLEGLKDRPEARNLVDIYAASTQNSAGGAPYLNVLDYAYMFRNRADQYHFLYSPLSQTMLREPYERRHGLKLLFSHAELRGIQLGLAWEDKDTVTSVEQLAGTKNRVTGTQLGRIAMTAMPQLVAAFHSLVGLAAVMVAAAALYAPESMGIGAVGAIHGQALVEMSIGVAIGAITFTGSVIAFLKLDGRMSGKPIMLPSRHAINIALGILLVVLVVWFAITESHLVFWLIVLVSLALGVLLIVPIGGASVGDHDHMRDAFLAAGATLHFERVAVKPGKPTWFGTLDGTPVLGLPGNPASAIVCAHLFLRRLMGVPPMPQNKAVRPRGDSS